MKKDFLYVFETNLIDFKAESNYLFPIFEKYLKTKFKSELFLKIGIKIA